MRDWKGIKKTKKSFGSLDKVSNFANPNERLGIERKREKRLVRRAGIKTDLEIEKKRKK